MASQVFPKKNAAFTFYIGLVDQADTKLFKSDPTLAAGDFQVSIDGAALGNLATLPSVDPASGKLVLVELSAAEMNGDNIQVIGSDAAGAEWCDIIINIQTTARQADDLAFPTVSGRSLDISAAGEAGIDWANIGSPTTAQDLSGTTVGEVEALGATAEIEVLAQVEAALDSAVADSVPADGSRPSVRQALLMITRMLMEASVVGTTLTVTKEDGTTSSMTFTLNDATNPTSITRAT